MVDFSSLGTELMIPSASIASEVAATEVLITFNGAVGLAGVKKTCALLPLLVAAARGLRPVRRSNIFFALLKPR